jgi:hypothetical protein
MNSAAFAEIVLQKPFFFTADDFVSVFHRFYENVAKVYGQCYNKKRICPYMGEHCMQKDLMRILSRMTLISQLGLSFVTPPLLLLAGALWLQNRTGIGDWILLCAIFVGCVSGGCAVFNLIRTEIKKDETSGKNHTPKGGPL